MKVVLEKEDLIKIVEKHFAEKFDRSRVTVNAEPFEVILSGMSVDSAMPDNDVDAYTDGQPYAEALKALSTEQINEATAALDRDLEAGETLEPPPPGLDEVDADDTRDVSPAALVAKSRLIEKDLERDKPALARKGGTFKPPADFKDEL